MSELDFTLDEVISEISQEYLADYITLAALVLVVYDAILAWPQEWKCIWKRKFSAITLLYVLIRYGTILDMSLQTFNIFWIPTTISSCKAVDILDYIIAIVKLFAVAAFNCLRIWAICRQRWFPVTVVFILSIFTPGANLYNFSRPQTWIIVSAGPLVGCSNTSTIILYQYLPIISRAISIASDLAVLIFTLLETAHTWRIGQPAQIKIKLTTMLIYNGALQFLIFLMLNVISVILKVLSATSLNIVSTASNFININDSVTSILLCRFLLDLRSVYQSSSNNSSSNHQNSSIYFASSILGNISATIDAPWAAEEDENEEINVEEDQSFIHSDSFSAIELVETVARQVNEAENAEAEPSDTQNYKKAISDDIVQVSVDMV